jgi:hypothetical protein
VAARSRAREEWVVAEDTHLPLVTNETYTAAQDHLASWERGPTERSRRTYLFAGMVRCATGHQPLSMQGKARKGHHYYACSYAAGYGDTAAADAHAGQKWIYLREDNLLRLVERFLAQRIFGPMRLDRLSRQLRAQRRDSHRDARDSALRIRQQLADLERRIKLQVQALEDGIEPDLVSQRIAELRGDHQALSAALVQIAPSDDDDLDDALATRLERIPDLTLAFRNAPYEVKRQTLEAFDVRITYDKAAGRIEVSAAVSEAVAQALETHEDPPADAGRAFGAVGAVTVGGIAGAGFEPATFGL